MVCHGQKKRRHHVEGFEFLLQKKIQSYCHDDCVADHTYLLKQLTLKHAAEHACKQRNAALIKQNGDKGENNAVAEGCGKDDCIHKVKRTFDKEH